MVQLGWRSLRGIISAICTLIGTETFESLVKTVVEVLVKVEENCKPKLSADKFGMMVMRQTEALPTVGTSLHILLAAT